MRLTDLRFKILVVDDEPDIRALLTEILSDQYAVLAAEGAGPALALFARQQPDIVVTDMRMPGQDGLALLSKLRNLKADLPVIMITGHGDKQLAIDALKKGAFDFLEKPFGDEELLSAVARAAGHCLLKEVDSAVYQRYLDLNRRTLSDPPLVVVREAVLAIGASFGGPKAITELLLDLPANIPPTLIVQHMLPDFLDAFAQQLNAVCPFQVKVAEDGEPLVPGKVLLGPGGRHLTVARGTAGYMIRLSTEPTITLHRPSVDVLFKSVAKALGAAAIGVILTGMGEDGALGLLELRKAGGTTIAQDESTSAVFGMPRKAIELNAAQEVLSLRQIAPRIRSLLYLEGKTAA